MGDDLAKWRIGTDGSRWMTRSNRNLDRFFGSVNLTDLGRCGNLALDLQRCRRLRGNCFNCRLPQNQRNECFIIAGSKQKPFVASSRNDACLGLRWLRCVVWGPKIWRAAQMAVGQNQIHKTWQMDSFRMWRVSCNWCFSMNLNLPTYHSPNIEDPPETMFFFVGGFTHILDYGIGVWLIWTGYEIRNDQFWCSTWIHWRIMIDPLDNSR